MGKTVQAVKISGSHATQAPSCQTQRLDHRKKSAHETPFVLPILYLSPRSGNSYIGTITWDGSDCPIADVISVYSQSSDPASDYYSDQTQLYSDKRWVRFPFCEEDIQAQQIGESLVIEE